MNDTECWSSFSVVFWCEAAAGWLELSPHLLRMKNDSFLPGLQQRAGLNVFLLVLEL